MKTIHYDLRIIHRKKIAIGALNRKEIDRILRDLITSGEALNMEGGEVVGIVVEEKGERDCPGTCDHCQHLCPENEDCMMDDLEDRCRSCEYGCEKCGTCSLIDYGVCGDEECDTQYQQATPLDCQSLSGIPPAACQGKSLKPYSKKWR